MAAPTAAGHEESLGVFEVFTDERLMTEKIPFVS